MAAKLKCSKCGAKNALDAQRCRLCTAVLSGGQATGLPGGRSAFGGGSGLGARIAAAGNMPQHNPAPLPGDTAWGSDQPWGADPAQPFGEQPFGEAPFGEQASTFGDAPFGESSFGDSPFGEQATGPAPSPTSGQESAGFTPFDPNALFDAPPPSSGDTTPSSAPTPDFEPFDPDALFRND